MSYEWEQLQLRPFLVSVTITTTVQLGTDPYLHYGLQHSYHWALHPVLEHLTGPQIARITDIGIEEGIVLGDSPGPPVYRPSTVADGRDERTDHQADGQLLSG